jgi:hypothetical protein
MSMRSWVPPFGPLAAIGAAITIHVYLGSLTLIQSAPQAMSRTETAESEGATDLDVAPLSDVKAGVESFQSRPLLAEGRRVPQPAPVEVIEEFLEVVAEPVIDPEPVSEPEPEITAPPPPELPLIQMLGSMSNANGDAVLIAEGPEGAQRWIRVGEDIAGWTVIEITSVSIRLSAGDMETSIGLFQ